MKKKSLIWTIAATASIATAITVYYLRRKKMRTAHDLKHGDRHLTNVFARAKEVASGEFTL
jgi:hypothetical protein